jgi:hypothetical protein
MSKCKHEAHSKKKGGRATYHVAEFEAAHKVLDGRAEVTSTRPHVFDESDLIRIDLQLFGEPIIVELNALVVPELVATHRATATPHTNQHLNTSARNAK